MSNTNQSFKELIEDEDDPKQLLENLKSKNKICCWNTGIPFLSI